MHKLLLSSFSQWDDKDIVQADMDRFVDDDDNVESFLSHDDTDPRDTVGRCMDSSKGELVAFSFFHFVRVDTLCRVQIS